MSKPILCLDFDGVIHSYTSKWEAAHIIPDDPVPGALEFIIAASEYFEIHIFSSRSHQLHGIDAMRIWIQKHALRLGLWPMKGEYMDYCQWYSDIQWPLQKPPAFLTIDDRAITFQGVWPDIAKLMEFKPWNKG